MHQDQVDVTAEVVSGLLAEQFPQWQGLELRPIQSHGTVNALFRLGDDLVLRFPLQPSLDDDLRQELIREQDHARLLSDKLPFPLPEPVALGEPGKGYAGPWAVNRWIPGEIVSSETVGDATVFAQDLGIFVKALHRIDPGGRSWNGTSRGGPLADLDAGVRAALAQSGDLTDVRRIEEQWLRALSAPPHPGTDVWIHADLMPGNLLIRGGRLAAVIDLGTVGVGDPAVDLMPAWNLLAEPQRDVFRLATETDEASWERGRGWAIVQSIIALPYYIDTNPQMAGTAQRTLTALLESPQP